MPKETTESAVRKLVEAGKVEYLSTEDVAAVLGRSAASVVKALKKVAEDGARDPEGREFVYNELEAKHRRGFGAGERQPKRYVWFYT